MELAWPTVLIPLRQHRPIAAAELENCEGVLAKFDMPTLLHIQARRSTITQCFEVCTEYSLLVVVGVNYGVQIRLLSSYKQGCDLRVQFNVLDPLSVSNTTFHPIVAGPH